VPHFAFHFPLSTFHFFLSALLGTFGGFQMAKLSAFPKCYMDELCVTKTMTLFEWIDLAASLGVDGVEMYPGFF
jgi:hypothetical protein